MTGAAHGDLSSEKVYVRFRTMTCAGPESGTVIETDVAGFVAGSGKTGVRGPVVSREGALVEKAFLAGLVSGVGQGVSQAHSNRRRSRPAPARPSPTPASAISAGPGSAPGRRAAGQKVADYMIRRAEQYQPVIQLQAGSKVTLVFLEGARIDGRGPVLTAQRGQIDMMLATNTHNGPNGAPGCRRRWPRSCSPAVRRATSARVLAVPAGRHRHL